MMNKYVLIIILYSFVMVLVGYFFTRHSRVKDAKDFFVARRSLDTKLLFSTLLASNIGAGSTIGLAGLAYKFGISAWWWIGASGLGSIFLAYWVGPRIYRIAKEKGFLTLGDYLEFRYSKAFRGFISLLMGVGTLAILGGQLLAIAWILEVISGLSKVYGVLLGAGVIVIYSAMGGLFSAVAVNMLQIIVKMFGFTFAAIFAYIAVGGFSGLIEKSAEVAERSATLFSPGGIGLSVIIGYFLMLTPSFCVSSGLIGKVYGAKDESTVKKGTALNGAAQWVFGVLIVFIGMSAYAMMPDLSNSEHALPSAIINLMPLWVAALALASIFSAEVSTCDALLYMIAGAWVNDFYKGLFNPTISSVRLLFLGRVAMICGGGIAIIFALCLDSIISALTIFYTLMSVCLTAPVFFGLFTKIADSRAAFLSSAVGVIVTIIFRYFTEAKIWILNAQSTGILFSLILMTFYCLWLKRCRIA
ncbi:MAG: sodium:solute symporter family protein [Deferribacteraceae bacterium]|jgi:SSS family solute:Na+ symporter|nr:sodium:solute symporter family protein [Deferribacteraceae bacterium]